MKTRAFLFALVVGVVSMNSGCCCFHNCFPNVGWRLHQGCGAPACAPPACAPCAPCGFRPPMVVSGGPDCPTCANGAPTIHQPVGYPPVVYPNGAYPPVIGNPMPLPGTGGAANELHSPTPTGK